LNDLRGYDTQKVHRYVFWIDFWRGSFNLSFGTYYLSAVIMSSSRLPLLRPVAKLILVVVEILPLELSDLFYSAVWCSIC
jgi:hypothetical protein